jgi:hypothetical protein
MIVVYVVTLALTGMTKVLTLVLVSMTVSFVPVQSIGRYGVEVKVEGYVNVDDPA